MRESGAAVLLVVLWCLSPTGPPDRLLLLLDKLCHIRHTQVKRNLPDVAQWPYPDSSPGYGREWE